MGKTIRLKYRVEGKDQTGAWQCGWRGRATTARLAEWVRMTNESMKLGGCNEHVSKAHGFIPIISRARIVNQDTGEVVAEYAAPLFQVI